MGAITVSATPPGGADTAYGPTGIRGLIGAPVVLALSLFASIGGVLFGYDQGAEQFPTLANDTTLKGWVVSILTLGAMFGALVNGPVADRLSRRWSISLAAIVFIIGSALQAGAVSVAMMFVGRFIAGFSIGMLSTVVPLYLSELAPPNLRGGLVSLQQLGITLGVMVSFWIDYGTANIQSQASWRVPLALQCAIALVLGIGCVFLPYSPRWFMLHGREEEAVRVLSRIRRVDPSDWRLQREILEIKAVSVFDRRTVEEQYPPTMSKLKIAASQYAELFTVAHLFRRLQIACLLQIIQQFTGINAMIYYALIIFEDIGLSGDRVNLLATGVVGVIDFVSTFPAIMFLDRWGRKTVLLVGGVGMAISQLIVGTLYAVYGNNWPEHKSAGWAAAAFIWIYIANFAFSIGCVNWIVPSELFPPGKRAKAVGLAISCNWLSNFVVGLVVPKMLTSIRFGTFYFFLAFCVILIVWVYWFVPETRGVRIEDMDKIFGRSQGAADVRRMETIRRDLGLDVFSEDIAGMEDKAETGHVEKIARTVE